MEDPLIDPAFQNRDRAFKSSFIEELPSLPTPEQLAAVLERSKRALEREAGANGFDAPFVKLGGRIYGLSGLHSAATNPSGEKVRKRRLYPPNVRNANPDLKEALKGQHVTVRLDQFRQIREMAVRYAALVKRAYNIEADLKEKGKGADQLFEAIAAFIEAFNETLPNSHGSTIQMLMPSYLMALRDEICNLRDGAASRLLALNGTDLSDALHGSRRLLWQARAAGFLRLFMDRDGDGGQKAAARKIVKALAAGGVLAPGPRKKPYRGRTVIEWMRKAERGEAAFTEQYRSFLFLMRTTPALGSLSLDDCLKSTTDFLKLQNFKPRGV